MKRPVGLSVEDKLKFYGWNTTESGCWVFNGPKSAEGYGILYHKGRRTGAHRWAYEMWVGPIPEDKPVIRHTCDNPPCINPDHLIAGTQIDNIKDRVERGRNRKGGNKGEDNAAARLTWEKVGAIRQAHLDGESITSLAEKYDISYNWCWNIVRYKRWNSRTTETEEDTP